MDILVTGGAGFIGSSLVERLLAQGHVVEVLDDLSSGSLVNLSVVREQVRQDASGALKFHQADVLDERVAEIVARRSPDVVFHLAGPTRKADRAPARQAEVGVVGTVRVLDAAARAGVSVIVSCASARAQADPLRGIPDRAAHEYLEAFGDRHGIVTSTVVLPTVYGPRQRTTTESSVVAVFVERVLDGQPCVVHGSGTQTRDLLFVDDAVDALVRAMSHPSGVTVEVGTGAQVSVRDLQAAVAQAAGVEVPVVAGAERPGEPGAVVVDPHRAHDTLGWESWTGLADGVAQTVDEARSVRDAGRT